jgi:uncharacterized repeat protein (TIGR03803 family)
MLQHSIRRALTACLAASALSIGLPALAQSYVQDYLPMNIIYDFTATEPGRPTAGLIFDKAGNLYGTESDLFGSSTYVNGAVFELSPPPAGSPAKGWKKTVLYNFAGGTDGSSPQGPLLMDAAGNLYGTTKFGGNDDCVSGYTCGTIFMLSPPAKGKKNWTETILHRFVGSDGSYPTAGLIFDAAGNLFGTAPTNVFGGSGSVYELSPPSSGQTAWSFKVIYSGANSSIEGTLASDAAGNLYGVTNSSAFKLSPPTGGQTAWTETEIASFGVSLSTSDGLFFDQAGNLYGTIRGKGRIFKLSPPSKGTRLVLSFPAEFSPSEGADPNCMLAIDAAGNLYGTTDSGAHNNGGTVFKLAPNGTITVLHKFDGNRDGSGPVGGPVVLDASGNIYGTSFTGATGYNGGSGAVWELLVH